MAEYVYDYDDDLLAYQWSPTGYLSGLTLPDSSRLEWLCYGPGHVSAIRFNREIVTEFVRDDLHREILRTQGALTQHRGYDAPAAE